MFKNIVEKGRGCKARFQTTTKCKWHWCEKEGGVVVTPTKPNTSKPLTKIVQIVDHW